MANVIATIGETNGKFYAKDTQGNIRELKSGDEIYSGETIVPDASNSSDAAIAILTTDGAQTIILNPTQEQLLDETLLNNGLNNEELVLEPNSLKEALTLNDKASQSSDATQPDVSNDAQDAPQPLMMENNRVENKFTAKSKDSKSSISTRDGDSTDINSDLRKAEWNGGDKEPIFRGSYEETLDASLLTQETQEPVFRSSYEETLDASLLTQETQEIEKINDVPVAVDDARVILKEGGASVTGQLLTNDIPGNDGLVKAKEIKEFTYNGTTREFDDANPTHTINGTTLGDLTVNRDGTWELDPNGVSIAEHTEDKFTYKIVDTDGDISNSATQPIMMFDADVADTIVTTTTEDTSKLILVNDQGGDITITDTTSTTSKTLGTNESINITRADTEVIGKVTNNGDGTITFTPSKHYCGDDANFGYEVTRSDNTTIVNDSVTVTVTPTAETKTDDTNNDGNFDVITQGDKNYGEIDESSSYDYISLTGLNVTNEDDRGNGVNPFASELTTIKLSGVPAGFKFKYNDGADHELTVTDVNDGITIPSEYINTLEVKPTDFFAGEIKIKMEVITVDCEDGLAADQDTAISSPDYLIINVKSVANGLQALDADQATGDEDAGRADGNTTNDSNPQTITAPENGIDLNITATTNDTSGRETVTAMIDKIPDGGAIYYSDTNGTVTIDKDGVVSGSNSNVTVLLDNGDGTWKINIENFINTAPLKFIPPHNSNEDYNFDVTAFTRDGTNYSSTTAPKIINVVVTGVADIPVYDDFKKLDSNETINTDVAKNIYSDVVIEDNSNTRNGATISFADLYKEAGLDSYDSDSETLSVVITNLGSSFSVQDATGISFNGKSGVEREWSFDVADLDKVVLQTSKNFSGDFAFKVKHITTEDDGHSKSFEKDVKILVKPLVEATVTTSASATEDTASQVSFAIKHQNGDTNETLDALWIKTDDVTGKDFTLYYSNNNGTTLEALTSHSTVDGDYYKLDNNAIDKIYIKYNQDVGSSNTNDDSFGIKYTVSDEATASNGDVFTSTNEEASGVYNISLLSVTDAISVDTSALNDIISTDDILYDDTASTVTINEVGTFSFDVDVTSDDTDNSENFTRIVIENVQRGITIDDTYATMAISGGDTNIWFLDIPTQELTGGTSSYSVNFKVNQSLQHYAETSIVKITAYAKDTGSASSDIQDATKNIEFINNLHVDGGPGATSTIDVDMNIHDITVTEDTQFALDGIIETLLPSNATNDAIANDASVTYTLAFSNLTNVSFDKANDSYTDVQVNSYGGEHYITITAQKSAIQGAVNTVLSNIKMIADENYNINNKGAKGELSFGVKLTAYVGDGWARDTTDVKTLDVDVVPVTDSITSNVAQTHVDEDDGAVGSAKEDGTTTINITFDTVDAPAYAIVQDAEDASAASTVAITHKSGIYGTLVWSGGSHTFDASSKVANVNIEDLNDDSLKFTPTEDASGNVKFTYTVFAKETGADNISETSKDFTISVAPVADGLLLPELKGEGDEDEFIQIFANYSALTSLKDAEQIDDDGSESISSMFIDGVPDGFLLYIGDSHQTMATKGSKTGTATIDGKDFDTYNWTINISGGIPKVWLKAPQNWSSTTEVDLKLDTVVKDGSSTTTVSKDFTVTVNSVADGFSSLTHNDTVQTASADVDINLNAQAIDLDGSETGILTLSGFGAGDVIFKQDGNDISANVVYDNAGGVDTYTISNIDLSTDKLNKLTFQKGGLQGVDIDYTFKTVEGDDNEESAEFTGTFKVTTDNIITDITTNGTDGQDDRLVLGGATIDFSTITSNSIEKIDLTTGDRAITNVTLDDVLDMTDTANNLLIITDDANDSVTLVSENGNTWTKDSDITTNGQNYEVYKNSGDSTLTLTISEEADVIM
jgi:hypothetical protein